MKKVFIVIFSLAMLLMGSRVAYIYYAQESILFQTSTLPQSYIFTSNLPFKELFLENNKGTGAINALYFPTSAPKKGIILYFHGRGKNLSANWDPIALSFTSAGYDVCIPDYRGFGKTTGRIYEKGMLNDSITCYNYLKKNNPEDTIILYGRSLGTGFATYVASRTHSKALILESPYFNLLELAIENNAFLHASITQWLFKYPMRTDQWITRIRPQTPIYIIHGTKDPVVPYTCSVRLSELIIDKNHSQLITVPEGTHKYLYTSSQYQTIMQTILASPNNTQVLSTISIPNNG